VKEPPRERVTGRGWRPRRYRRITRSGRSSTEQLNDFPIRCNTRLVQVERALTPSQWIELHWSSLTAEFYQAWMAS
jgi:hypothetical protein